MEETPKPGMWITQNLVSHQSDYNIFHIKDVRNKIVYFDVKLNVRKSGTSVYPGKWKTNFQSPDGVASMPTYVFSKQMFQKMKRPSPDIRRAAIKSLFMYERE